MSKGRVWPGGDETGPLALSMPGLAVGGSRFMLGSGRLG